MTSSKLSDLLMNKDFAEMAAEHKRRELLAQKSERELQAKKEAEKAEMERIAALPKITDEDLTRAEKIGFEKGVEAGKEQAKTELKEEFISHLGEMKRQIEDMPAIIREQLALMQKSSLGLIKVIIKHTINHASEHYNEEVLEFILNQALEKSNKKAKLTLSFAPSSRFYLEKQSKGLFKDVDILLIEDESLEKSDCIIRWDNSGVDARISEISKEIDKIIDAAVSGVKPDKIDFDFIKKDKEEAISETKEAGTDAVNEEKTEEVEEVSQAADKTIETIEGALAEPEEISATSTENNDETQKKSPKSNEDVTNNDKKDDINND